MSDKMTCPGCDARTSDVLAHFQQDEPCPYCGLSAQAAMEVLRVRQEHADAGLKEQLEATLIRADKAEAEAVRLTKRLQSVRDALDNDD